MRGVLDRKGIALPLEVSFMGWHPHRLLCDVLN
jgi:hypothetical protein